MYSSNFLASNLSFIIKIEFFIFFNFSNNSSLSFFKKIIVLSLGLLKVEKELNVNSTYFILLSTDFYNINSDKSLRILKEIKRLGGKIGLHFDEKKYKISDKEYYIKYVN